MTDKATIAGRIIVSAQTTYPSVSGKLARAGASISAPHTPQASTVTIA